MRTPSSLFILPAALTLLSQTSAHPSTHTSAPLKFSNAPLAMLSDSSPQDPELKPRMDMPDSPPSSTEPTSWRLGTQLPVSYRVAIAVDVFVLLITICSLVLLGVYIRRQYKKRKMGLLHDFDGESEEEGDDKGEEAGLERRRGQEGERKKKGHVRWTSSVVGMGVFVEWDVSHVEGKTNTIWKAEKKGENGSVNSPKDSRKGGRSEVGGE